MRLVIDYCRLCGGKQHQWACAKRESGTNWLALMEYKVRDGHEMTLEEIGEIAGVSRERIRQIEFRALRRLQHRPSVRKVVSLELEAS